MQRFHWQTFRSDLRAWLATHRVHIALLDGTCFSPDKLPGRDLAPIPRPLAQDTARHLAHVEAEVAFIHLNHTNPLWRSGEERAWIEGLGLRVGVQGDVWSL